jgi:hypothetical protein
VTVQAYYAALIDSRSLSYVTCNVDYQAFTNIYTAFSTFYAGISTLEAPWWYVGGRKPEKFSGEGMEYDGCFFCHGVLCTFCHPELVDGWFGRLSGSRSTRPELSAP